MTILFLEDRGSVSIHITEKLEQDGYDVVSAYNINDAQSAWESRKEKPIDCLIVDLNMPADGLSGREKEETKGGLLTGWIWLREHVFKEDPDTKTKTVIFSEYLDLFRMHVLESEYEGVVTIPKRAPYSPVEKLLKCVKKIALEGR
jgi:CheY-like chemotaxis protein